MYMYNPRAYKRQLTKHSQLGLNAKYYFWRDKEEKHRVQLETQSRDSMHKTLLLL